jgi:hypothetical protein
MSVMFIAVKHAWMFNRDLCQNLDLNEELMGFCGGNEFFTSM